MTLPCIVCDKELESALPEKFDDVDQPYAGTSFYAHGQYGSTIFDPMDGSFLKINICDDCLDKKAKQQAILIGFPKKPNRLWGGGPDYQYDLDRSLF